MATLDLLSIGDGAHPDLATFSTLRRRRDLERQARFVAEGDKVVERLLDSEIAVEALLVTRTALERLRPRIDRRDGAIRVFVAERREEVERLLGFADASAKAIGRLDRVASVDDVLRETRRPRLFVALDGLSNAENVGSVVRNAAAMGAQAVVVGETSCSPFLTRAIRTSMGAIFTLPAVEREPLVPVLARLRATGVRCVAAHPAGAKSLPDVDLSGDCCVVLGSEADGISVPVLAACDVAAAIPMASGVDSMNVASAAAAFFYEAWRQRRAPSRPPGLRP